MIVHRLALDGGHVMHVEEHGSSGGQPVLVLHGGPGTGHSPLLRSFLDPARYRIVCPDQRGAGRSTPAGEVGCNSLEHLLADLRLLRTTLQVDRWLVVGGSWGATLALAHAIDQPAAVAGLLLRNVFLARASDVSAFFDAALRSGIADWQTLQREADSAGCTVLQHLAQIFESGTPERQSAAAQTWWNWEQQLAGEGIARPLDADALQQLRQRYRVQSHYLKHQCWLADPPLLERCSQLPNVPILMLHGTRDAICPPEGAAALRQILGQRALLRWIPGAGHDPRDPAMVAAMEQALKEFDESGTFGTDPHAPRRPPG